ncbi:MAG: cation transporter [Deltaproteobacteria bacterium]|nr:cation transporter [Deltaproteobacteria bacterium]
MTTNHAKRSRAATLALVATLFLTVAKVAVAIFTGSIGVLSEAIHSGLDLVSSVVTFFVVRATALPADYDHPFGHGKIESLSAMFEAVLLLVAGGFIVYEGASKWASGEHHVHNVAWGVAVTGVSVVVNLFVYFQNRGVARSEESIAIETNAFHFLTDVFTSLAVFLSLGALSVTNWVFLDPLVALVIAAYVFWVGIEQIKKCVKELSDSVLPDEELQTVRRALEKHQKEYLNYHDLRTRKAGAVRYVEFHLEVCSEQRVAEAHAVCDRIEDDIHNRFREVDVNIHVEPCGNHGPQCSATCRFYNEPRGSHA